MKYEGVVMIVVGAGLSGCVIARQLAESGYHVDLYEKKDHIGGAIYDYIDSHGTMIHSFGPHIFHTNIDEIHAYVQKYSKWNVFTHRVLGDIKGNLCPIPFNFTSIEKCFDPEQARLYQEKLVQYIGMENTITIKELAEINDEDLRQLAAFIYEHVFFHYTKKQWGRTPQELGHDIMGRVPVRVSIRDDYFSDRYQLMPQNGYTAFLQTILKHHNIHLHLKCDADNLIHFKDKKIYFNGSIYDDALVYTGCIDRLLNYKHGTLPYRTLRFEFETKQWPFQPVAVVNYPNAPGFTRITEFGHFYPEKEYHRSTIMREYPQEYQSDAELEPFYPIPIAPNDSIYRAYLNDLKEIPNLYPAGRLGRYQYMNMDIAIFEGLNLANKIIADYKPMS